MTRLQRVEKKKGIILWEEPEGTHFICLDVEVYSKTRLTRLVEAWGDDVLVHFEGRSRSRGSEEPTPHLFSGELQGRRFRVGPPVPGALLPLAQRGDGVAEKAGLMTIYHGCEGVCGHWDLL